MDERWRDFNQKQGFPTPLERSEGVNSTGSSSRMEAIEQRLQPTSASEKRTLPFTAFPAPPCSPRGPDSSVPSVCCA